MVNFNIKHTTTYTYDNDIYDSRNLIRLYPIDDEFQKVISHQLTISGNPIVTVSTDSFGNKIGVFTMPNPHRELTIVSDMEIQTQPRDVFSAASNASQTWDEIQLLATDSAFQLFLNNKDSVPLNELSEVVHSFQPLALTPFQAATAFNEYIFRNFVYNPSVTNVFTTLPEVWSLKAGVCQDFARVLIYMLRLVNLPARYVSGYICPNNDGLRGDGASHAWVEVYLPSYGWLGLDPTNNCCVADKHVKLAVGRDYEDVAPLKGEFKGQANQWLNVLVTVSYNTVAEPV